MKILKHGKSHKPKTLKGTCQCGCRVEVTKDETRELIDRDTTPEMATRHVTCPECGHSHLWVK